MSKALLIVDVQSDFCEGGSLAVTGGTAVARSISDLVGFDRGGGAYHHVVACKDWHIDPAEHFAAPGDEPDFVNTWPVHCVAGTPGAQFHPELQVALDEVFAKGRYTASYSGFDGRAVGEAVGDGDATTSEGDSLEDWLKQRDVTELHIVGLATDYCVRATALDAAAAGFATTVLVDHCAGVAPESTAAALEELAVAGVASG